MSEVDDRAVEAVGDRRAGGAAGGVVRAVHEVVDEQLRTSFEQVGEGCRALVGVEPIVLIDPDPGQLLPPPRQFVAAVGELPFGLEQFEPGGKPLVTCSDLVIGQDRKSTRLNSSHLGISYAV